MKIKLFINGEEKEFRTKFINGRMFRRAIHLQKKAAEAGVDREQFYDEMTDFCVEVFNNEFTSDQYLDGIDNTEYESTLFNVVLFCINGTTPMKPKKLNDEVTQDTH